MWACYLFTIKTFEEAERSRELDCNQKTWEQQLLSMKSNKAKEQLQNEIKETRRTAWFHGNKK